MCSRDEEECGPLWLNGKRVATILQFSLCNRISIFHLFLISVTFPFSVQKNTFFCISATHNNIMPYNIIYNSENADFHV